MKTKRIAKSSMVVFAMAAILQLTPNVFAHETSQEGILAKSYMKEYGDYYIGGEDIGWSIDEKHHSEEDYITYSFALGDNPLNNYKECVKDAADKWAGTVIIGERIDGSGTGKFRTYYGYVGVVAQFCEYVSDNNGHLTSWEIKLNLNNADLINETVIAHELGHVIGLNDLYEPKNNDKLMFGIATSCTATSPTTYDKLGAQVITGQHTTHSWGYKYYSTSGQGSNSHVQYCTVCKGHRANSVANCVYNLRKICIYCGIPQGMSPFSLNTTYSADQESIR